MRWHWLLWVGLLTAVSGCRDTRSPPNVLLISIDTLRLDHTSLGGYRRATTPRLVELAAEGARFDLAYAPCATTAPTHASILTSLYPIAHGVIKNAGFLGSDLQTLPEILGAAGYATAAVVSSFVLDAKWGFAQGFTHYDDDFAADESDEKTKGTVSWEEGETVESGAFSQTADQASDKAIHWLERERPRDRPFLLFVHYFDPHDPYVPPEPFASRFARDRKRRSQLARTIDAYDAEIAFTDSEVGRLLDALEAEGLDRDTLVVVIGDHGEGLMTHGLAQHGAHIYEEQVRVPFVIRHSGRIAPRTVVAEPVGLVDLLPTILDLAGVPIPAGVEVQGRSLAAALEGTARLDPERPVFLYRRHYEPGQVNGIPVAGEKLGVRIGEWKYIEGEAEGTRELFDLTNDPGERVNLYEPTHEAAVTLQSRLREWSAEYGRKGSARPSPSEEDLERLRSLGYVQ